MSVQLKMTVGKIQSAIYFVRGYMPSNSSQIVMSSIKPTHEVKDLPLIKTHKFAFAQGAGCKLARALASNHVAICLASCILLLAPFSASAQDPNFSQFEMNPLYYNPAYAGSVTDLRFGINYRNLWLNVPGMKFPGPLSTYNFYGDKQMTNALVGGLGFFVLQNFKGEGFLRHTSAGILYAWRMPTQNGNYTLSFGTKIYFNELKIDWSRLVFSDQVDPERGYLATPSAFIPQNDGKNTYLDIDAGLTFGFNVFQNKADEQKWTNELSFAVAHLLRPDISLNEIESQLPMKFTLVYNTSFPLSKNKFYINPKVLFEKQDNFLSYTYGFNIYVVKRHPFKNAFSRFYFSKPLYLGFYFRNPKLNDMKNTKSLIFVAGHTGKFPSSDTRYQLGVSYDFTIGGLNLSTWGALEVSATIILATKNISKKYNRYCPKFSSSPMSPVN